MATLYIAAWDVANEVLFGEPIQEISVSIGGASAQSAAISGSTTRPAMRRVRLFADADCFVTWGSNPTASSANGRPMGAENPEVFGIPSGDLIAVITRA